ncbi:MAG: CDP-alcohol phosphatidyltransferase family protein [Thermoplasmata archaeon]|nr:CDP-alcohol phosphatidyltransferase family protein [Thermoplasmata archaeon]
MVLDEYRSTADKVLIPIAKRININPNILTWVAFVFAVLAGVALYLGELWMLLLAALFIFLNAFLDALDGKVAKLQNKAGKRGDFLDHVLDRYADIFIIGGIMLGPYCDTLMGFLGLLGVLLASYMGTQAQAIGVKRDYHGILGRADRLVILTLTPLIQYFLIYWGFAQFGIAGYEFTFFEYVMLYFAVAGNITAIQRGVKTWRRIPR